MNPEFMGGWSLVDGGYNFGFGTSVKQKRFIQIGVVVRVCRIITWYPRIVIPVFVGGKDQVGVRLGACAILDLIKCDKSLRVRNHCILFAVESPYRYFSLCD